MGKNSRRCYGTATVLGLKLVIVHSHYRPGGARRIIELAAPHLAAALGPQTVEITLVGGEAPDATWRDRFAARMGAVRVAYAIEPALGYFSEQTGAVHRRSGLAGLVRRIGAHLEQVLMNAGPGNCVVWAHNQGLGRNLLVTRALARVCAARGVPLVFHHHDWWFDNRWARWPEMRRAGFRTLNNVAHTILPAGPNVRQVAINQADAKVLQRHFGAQAGWLPNLSEPAPSPPVRRVREARRWLHERIGGDAPVWLVPCRLLRRKNLAEALLLTRWLRPEAWLVTTGGASSVDERAYAATLAQAARRHDWRLRLGVLADGEAAAPPVPDLLAASEAVLLTSLQEGFGLPNLEAAAAGRPLIARRLPNIAPDLARFGFQFPQAYEEVWVDPRLFDWPAEVRRQTQRWSEWRTGLPRACRLLAGAPTLLADQDVPAAVPFSRLTLIAQLEVLAHDAAHSWATCAALNPLLGRWRESAACGALQVAPWPRGSARWLSGPAYARRFAELLNGNSGSAATVGRPPDETASRRVFDEFIRSKLAGENQYPLLWTSEP